MVNKLQKLGIYLIEWPMKMISSVVHLSSLKVSFEFGIRTLDLILHFRKAILDQFGDPRPDDRSRSRNMKVSCLLPPHTEFVDPPLS